MKSFVTLIGILVISSLSFINSSSKHTNPKALSYITNELAFCSYNFLPQTGTKTNGSECRCVQPGPDPLHGYVSTCDELNSNYCQREGCTNQVCCHTVNPN